MSAPLPWEGMGHAEIHALAHAGPGPGASTHAEDLWRRVAEIVAAGEAAMDQAVRRSEGMWEGSAGDGARTGLHELNAWARDAATDAANTTAAMGNQGVHAGHLRSTVPEPYTAEYAAAERFASENPFDEGMQRAFLSAQDEKALRDEDARQKMAVYHYDSVRNRSLMDVWTTPPTVVVEAAGAGGVSGGAVGGGTSGAGAIGGAVGGPGGEAIGAGGVGGAGAGSGSAAGAGAAGAGAPGTGTAAAGAGVGGASAGGSGAGAGAIGGGAAAAGVVGAAGAAAGGGGTTGGRAGGLAGPAGGSGAPISAAAAAGPGVPATAGRGGRGGAGSTGSGPPTGSGTVGAPGRTAPPPTGRDSLPPGAGGRGPRVPALPIPTDAAQPAARASAPSATWRDLVAAHRPPERSGGEFGARPGAEAGRPSTGTSPPSAAGQTSAGQALRPDGVRTGGPITGPGHPSNPGVYPPTAAGAPGATGETRRRAPYLLDDSGMFDVEDQLHHTDPVIRGTDQEQPLGR